MGITLLKLGFGVTHCVDPLISPLFLLRSWRPTTLVTCYIYLQIFFMNLFIYTGKELGNPYFSSQSLERMPIGPLSCSIF